MDDLLIIGPQGRGHPRLETLVATLRVSRRYLLEAARGLDAATLDAKPAGAPNTIGALLSHVAAAEVMITNITGDGVPFTSDQDHHARAFRFLGNPLEGQDVGAYEALLDGVRKETVAKLRERDDAWLEAPRTFAGRPSDTHYYWTHLVLDEARHTGQITLIRKYLLAESDPAFEPYGFLTSG